MTALHACRFLVAAAMFLLSAPWGQTLAHAATDSGGAGVSWGDGEEPGSGSVESDGETVITIGDSGPGDSGDAGAGGRGGGGGQGQASDGFYATYRTIDFSQDPPCLYTTGRRFAVGSQTAADTQAAALSRQTDTWVEMQLGTAGILTRLCDAPPIADPADPGLDAASLVDLIRTQIPRPTPTISGGRAITGNRSWLDLGRPATWTFDGQADLGVLGTRSVTVNGTAETTVDWGDGTVTDHAGPGGPYRPGEPGPDDIAHTYIDTGAPTITITDTWTLAFTVQGISDTPTITVTLDPVPLPIEVTEVRSVRNA